MTSWLPLPAGSTVRFRVRDADGRSGSSWSVRTAAHSGDVYVSHREGGRWVHTSFHESGQWHYTVTSEGQALDPGSPPYLGVITEHAEIAPGWLHAMRITVARDELRSGWVERVRERPVVEVPADTGFDAVSIDVLLGATGAAPIRVDEHAFLIAELARGDGGSVVVIAVPTDLDVPVRVALAPLIREAVARSTPTELPGDGWRLVTASLPAPQIGKTRTLIRGPTLEVR